MSMIARFILLDEEDLETIASDADSLEDVLFPEDVEDPFVGQYSLDKAWHAIHYLLTGSIEPDGSAAGDAILGGQPVGTDLGYGPARLIDREHVHRIAAALQQTDFASAYNSLDRSAAIAANLYGGFEFTQEEREYLQEYFQTLLEVYSTAAKGDNALLAYLG